MTKNPLELVSSSHLTLLAAEMRSSEQMAAIISAKLAAEDLMADEVEYWQRRIEEWDKSRQVIAEFIADWVTVANEWMRENAPNEQLRVWINESADWLTGIETLPIHDVSEAEN